MVDENINKAVEVLEKSRHTTAFTGAGISVESGVPPFRGEKGIWNKYDPKCLEIEYFFSHPVDSWHVIKEIFYDFFQQAKPNPAHLALAQMEEKGLLQCIITQNIDNLHQRAGSKEVYEYHGNSQQLICMDCRKKYMPSEVNLESNPPCCSKDGGLLKPDFVFFGEAIPARIHEKSVEEAHRAEVFILIGTTGEVMPACMVPRLAKEKGATIIEINTEESLYTHSITDIFIQGKAGEVMMEVTKKMFS